MDAFGSFCLFAFASTRSCPAGTGTTRAASITSSAGTPSSATRSVAIIVIVGGTAFLFHKHFDQWGELLHRGHEFLYFAYGRDDAVDPPHSFNDVFDFAKVRKGESACGFSGSSSRLGRKNGRIDDGGSGGNGGRAGERISYTRKGSSPKAALTRSPASIVHMRFVHGITPFLLFKI